MSGQSPPSAESGTDSSGELPPLVDPRTLLRRYGLRPRKGLGQHYLVDRHYLACILEAAGLRPTDTVLEIGAGLGTLTVALAARAGQVVAVEVDPAMQQVLAELLSGRENVTLVGADILAVEPGDLLALPPDYGGRREGYKVVSNLPYYITSAALRHILEARVRPELAVVTVQREVADRILAGPGQMSILAVAVQFYAHPQRVAVVPAGAFYPRPKVDSTILRLQVHDRPPVDISAEEVDAFFRTVRAGFGQKRKQLKNSLAAGLQLSPEEAGNALRAAGIDPRRRAQTLSLAEWARLTRALLE